MEVMVIETKNLLLEQYLNKIKPSLIGIIIVLQEFDTWKIQLTTAINFISSKDLEEECVMHSKSNNIKFMFDNCANEAVDKPFDSFCSRYQGNLNI